MFEMLPSEPVFASLGERDQWEILYEGRAASELRYELYREAGPGHRLQGKLATALARCTGCGLVAFHLGDATWALVELTGSGRPEPSPLPRHQRVESFASLRDAMGRHRH